MSIAHARQQYVQIYWQVRFLGYLHCLEQTLRRVAWHYRHRMHGYYLPAIVLVN